MESYEAHLAEIQSLLEAKEEVKVPHNEDQNRNREAKTFDQLSVDEKMKLVAFNARMSQARDLDFISAVQCRRAPKIKDGKPQLPWRTAKANKKRQITNMILQSYVLLLQCVIKEGYLTRLKEKWQKISNNSLKSVNSLTKSPSQMTRSTLQANKRQSQQ